LQEELVTAAAELETTINRLRNDPPDPDSYDAWLDRINEINQGRDENGPISDQDIQAAGLPVG